MYRFANPEYLYALYLIPLFILVYWYTRRLQKRGMNNFANSAMHKVLIPLKSRFKSLTKFIVSMIAFVLLTIGVANPQIGTRIEEVKQVGIDVFILLDVSLSMKAEDIKPSRLEKAKYSIGKLVQKLQGDRIGLIVFSGAAYVQFPLTTDYAAASLFLNSVDVSSVPQPGTAIEPAIQLAMSSFKSDAETKKAIVVITDGEDHEGDLDKIAKSATEKGVSIYTIGYGSPAGVPIPVYNSAGVRVDYKKDRYSNVVLTKLDENTLKQLASAGGESIITDQIRKMNLS